jgi:alanyl-tRNA synthetase
MQLKNKGQILKKIYHDLSGKRSLTNYGIDISDEQVKNAYITGKEAFNLYQSYGFPIEMIMEMAQAKNLFVTFTDFRSELVHHQKLSRQGAEKKFKGGLADAGEETTKLHTTAHLMLAALRQVLGDQIEQKGSNITAERLRFDFNNPDKLTDDQIKKVEAIVNKNIEADLPVMVEEMSIEEAKNSGATGSFSDRYGEKVKVYTIGCPSIPSGHSGSGETIVSREICGGPHADHTGVLGHFKIIKEESSSAGIRRIKSILE